MRAAFLSDVHLRHAEAEQPRIDRVVAILKELQGQTDMVVILGDLFDFFMGFPGAAQYFPLYRPIFHQLHRLVVKGSRVIYIEGNHDFHLGRFFTQELGVEVYPSEYAFRLDDLQVFAAHGDLVNPLDKGYLFLRRLLRSPLIRWLMHYVPGRVILAIAERASRKSRAYTAGIDLDSDRMFRRFVMEQWREGADVVILGHNHRPARETMEFEKRKRYYFNLGLWHDTASPYLIWDGSRFHWRDALGAAQPELVNETASAMEGR